MLLRAILALASHAILLVLAIPTANQHDQLGEDTAISKAALTTKLFNAIEDVAAINHDGRDFEDTESLNSYDAGKAALALHDYAFGMEKAPRPRPRYQLLIVFEAICTIPVNRQPPLSIKTVGEGSLYFLTKGREGIKLNWQTPTIIKTELGGPEGDKQSDANYLLELILLGAYPPGHKDHINCCDVRFKVIVRFGFVETFVRAVIQEAWLECKSWPAGCGAYFETKRYDCVVSLPASYVANQDSAV